MTTVLQPGPYPAELERDVDLRDGSRVHIRPVRSDDAERLIALHARLSLRTSYQRFFTVMPRLRPDWARRLASVDYVRRLALVATINPTPTADIVAVARYEATSDPAVAEVAFVVQDGMQEKGLGTILFRLLLDAARARGVSRFRACVLADNKRMLDLIGRFSKLHERRLEQNVVELTFADGAAGGPSRD